MALWIGNTPSYGGPPVSGGGQNPWSNPYRNQDWLTGYDMDHLNRSEGWKSAWQMLVDRTNAPTSARNWLDTQYNNMADLYNAEYSKNGNLKWTDFLGNYDIQTNYQNETPDRRGVNSSGLASRMKYLGW